MEPGDTPEGVSGESKPPRTPAQREASRRNGSKSRGPVTAQGKRISSLNALRHGILSRMASPVDSHFWLEQSQIRRALYAEFRPRTFSVAATVDSLVNDYMRLALIMRMMSILTRPRRDEKENDPATQYRNYLQLHGLLREAISCIEAGGNARLSDEQLEYLVPQIIKNIKAMKSPKLHDMLRTRRRLLLNEQSLENLLSRPLEHHAAIQGRLLAMLNILESALSRLLQSQKKYEKQEEKQLEQALMNLTRDPNRLLLLERYRAETERSISSKLKALNERPTQSTNELQQFLEEQVVPLPPGYRRRR